MFDNTKGLLEIFQALFFDAEFRDRYFDALDLSTIVQFVYEGLDHVGHWSSIAVLLPGEDGLEIADCRNLAWRQAVTLDNEIIPHLLTDANRPIDHAALIKKTESMPLLGKQVGAWTDVGICTWLPLVHQGQLEAVLVLGGEGSRGQDGAQQQMIQDLADQASEVFARSRIASELRGQIQEVKALSQQLLALQDKNQQRLAIELHDQTVQDLIFVIRLLEQARQRTLSPVPEIEGAIDEVLRIIDDLRATIFDLWTPETDRNDLEMMLNDYIVSFQERKDLPIAFRCQRSCSHISVSKTIQLVCFRILQESLNNIWRHAQASAVDVILDLQSERLLLEICDDGLGFDVPERLGDFVERGHLGLIGMRERATNAGGQLALYSQIGQGTSVLFEISLSAG